METSKTADPAKWDWFRKAVSRIGTGQCSENVVIRGDV